MKKFLHSKFHTGDLQKNLWWLVFLHLRSLLKHLIFPPTFFLKAQNNIYQVVAVNQYNGEATLQVLFFLYINRTVCRNQYRCKICCFCSPKQCFVIKSEMRLFHQNFLKCNLKYWPKVVNWLASCKPIPSHPLLFVCELGGMFCLFLLAKLLNTFFNSNVVNNELKKK